MCSLPLRDSHPLRSGGPDLFGSPTLFSSLPCGCRVLQPQRTCPLVWALPRSLATTSGILSLPQDTWMFRFSWCPSSTLWIQLEDAASSSQRVSPFGNSRILRLQTAPRDFSQSTASFFGSWRQGIHPVPFVAYSRDCSLVNLCAHSHRATQSGGRDFPHHALSLS